MDFSSNFLSQERLTEGVSKRHHSKKHNSELKYKILHGDNKGVEEFALPPYLRKRNRRYKSIYEAMHEDKIQESQSGRVQYHQFIHKNEIPDEDSLTKLFRNSLKSIKHDYKHHKNHHSSKLQHKIKKLRSRPEAGIMQKKLKI